MNISYFTNFIVYIFAMSGVLLTAVFIYKKFCTMGVSKQTGKFLTIKDQITIAPRKTLYVVKAGEEYFLIAGDTEHTTMLSKLNSGNENSGSTGQVVQTWGEDITNKKILQRLNERFKN